MRPLPKLIQIQRNGPMGFLLRFSDKTIYAQREWASNTEADPFSDSETVVLSLCERIEQLERALKECAGWNAAYGQPESREIVRAALPFTLLEPKP